MNTQETLWQSPLRSREASWLRGLSLPWRLGWSGVGECAGVVITTRARIHWPISGQVEIPQGLGPGQRPSQQEAHGAERAHRVDQTDCRKGGRMCTRLANLGPTPHSQLAPVQASTGKVREKALAKLVGWRR